MFKKTGNYLLLIALTFPVFSCLPPAQNMVTPSGKPPVSPSPNNSSPPASPLIPGPVVNPVIINPIPGPGDNLLKSPPNIIQNDLTKVINSAPNIVPSLEPFDSDLTKVINSAPNVSPSTLPSSLTDFLNGNGVILPTASPGDPQPTGTPTPTPIPLPSAVFTPLPTPTPLPDPVPSDSGRLGDVSVSFNPSAPEQKNFGRINSLVITNDSKVCIIGSSGPNVKAWDLNNQYVIDSGLTHERGVNTVALAANLKFLASGGDDHLVKIKKFTDDSVHVLAGHTGKVLELGFNPAGNLLVSSGDDGLVIFWNLGTGAVKAISLGSPVRALAFGKNDDLVIAGSDDGYVRVIHAPSKELRFNLEGHSGKINDLAVNPAGSLLASAGNDGTVRIWKLQTGELIARFENKSLSAFTSLAFDLNDHLVGGTAVGEIYIWNLATEPQPQLSGLFRAHTGPVNALTFTPDGNTLVSGGADGLIKVLRDPEFSLKKPE